MNIVRNEGLIDRLMRIIASEILLLLGYFWLGSPWKYLLFAASAILLLTAATGFCPAYRLFGWDTTGKKKINPLWPGVIFGFLFLAIAGAGSYYSVFFTRKIFLEDYNRLNGLYKQTLFFTGQDQRAQSQQNYAELTAQLAVFRQKYLSYRPFTLRSDAKFGQELSDIAGIIEGQSQNISSGDLKQAHLEFEKVRSLFQDMLKRNGFSMLAVYLVDFHDSMEKVIAAADAKDSKGLITAYQEADSKLKEVESIADDQEIQDIRGKLEEVKVLAEQDKRDSLSAKAQELKSAFVKVYLKRG